MGLKPDTAAFLAAAAARPGLPARAVRTAVEEQAYLQVLRTPPPSTAAVVPVARVSEHDLGDGLAVRVYIPDGPPPFPLVVYFHGGGWVSGDLAMHDGTCRRIANRAQCVVVNVDYRLAPEHRFPAAVDDARRAVCWAQEHADALLADPRRLAVAGTSAGGNLAAAVALRARDEGGPDISLQVLVYPVVDATMSSASYRTLATGYLLDREMMEWFWEQYVPEPDDRLHPWASPLHATSLAGLPAAVVVTAEFDPLRDEGEAYAARLADAGVPVLARRYDGQIHSFFGYPDVIADADRAISDISALVSEHFADASRPQGGQ